MGWKGEGHGLGKLQQGISVPIEIEDLSRNRFGLGFNFYDDYSQEIAEMDQATERGCISQMDINMEDTASFAIGGISKNPPLNSNPKPTVEAKAYNINPIKINRKVPRLGDVIKNIRELLVNFVNSSANDDLVFDKSLTIEDRKLVHREAHKLGLKTRSEGSANNRFIVVRKKLTANELIESAMKNGGQISRYEIISNGSQNQ